MSYESSATGVFSAFSLFATQLAAGVVLALLAVPLPLIGRRFIILMSLVSVVLAGLAIVDRGLEIGYWFVAFAGTLVVYNIILPRQPGVDAMPRRRPTEATVSPAATLAARLLLTSAAAFGVAGLVADALAFPLSTSADASQSLWLTAGAVSSALLLGSALVTMVLGHWYLVVRGLSFAPFRRLTLILGGALCLRFLVVAVSAWAQRGLWVEIATAKGTVGFLLSHGVFLAPRVLVGLVVPLVLARMVWKCVAIRSNQSATGLLYVVVAFVIIGEILAKHFLASSGLML